MEIELQPQPNQKALPLANVQPPPLPRPRGVRTWYDCLDELGESSEIRIGRLGVSRAIHAMDGGAPTVEPQWFLYPHQEVDGIGATPEEGS